METIGCDTLTHISPMVGYMNQKINVWIVVAGIEFLVILILLVVHRKSRFSVGNVNRKQKRDAISKSIDFENVIESAFHAEGLYEQLKTKCHPDKFVSDAKKNEIALDIFQNISKNRHNIDELQNLKERAIIELGVKF